MNDLIIKEISKDLNITEKQVNVVLELLAEGNTVPFIARYRKESTGALDEEYSLGADLLKIKFSVSKTVVLKRTGACRVQCYVEHS